MLFRVDDRLFAAERHGSIVDTIKAAFEAEDIDIPVI